MSGKESVSNGRLLPLLWEMDMIEDMTEDMIDEKPKPIEPEENEENYPELYYRGMKVKEAIKFCNIRDEYVLDIIHAATKAVTELNDGKVPHVYVTSLWKGYTRGTAGHGHVIWIELPVIQMGTVLHDNLRWAIGVYADHYKNYTVYKGNDCRYMQNYARDALHTHRKRKHDVHPRTVTGDYVCTDLDPTVKEAIYDGNFTLAYTHVLGALLQLDEVNIKDDPRLGQCTFCTDGEWIGRCRICDLDVCSSHGAGCTTCKGTMCIKHMQTIEFDGVEYPVCYECKPNVKWSDYDGKLAVHVLNCTVCGISIASKSASTCYHPMHYDWVGKNFLCPKCRPAGIAIYIPGHGRDYCCTKCTELNKTMRRCPTCYNYRGSAEFSVDKRTLDGFSKMCTGCKDANRRRKERELERKQRQEELDRQAAERIAIRQAEREQRERDMRIAAMELQIVMAAEREMANNRARIDRAMDITIDILGNSDTMSIPTGVEGEWLPVSIEEMDWLMEITK